MSPDLVTVVICTRDRPQDILRACVSLLKSEGVDLELIVVDQSESDDTSRALETVRGDARFRYLRAHHRGKSVAMNVGFANARSDIVVCTDDDCEPPPGWVARMAATLREHSHAGAVFSNVAAGPHDASAGYIPTYVSPTDRALWGVLAARHGWGMGASMALRKEAVLDLGGFDECIGPGARFPSGDDVDMELRLLLTGWCVLHIGDCANVHHGFRTLSEGRAHILRILRGNGATMAKLLRCGHPSALALAMWVFTVKALGPPIIDILHLRPPRGLRRVLAYSCGFVSGLRTPVDPRTMKFRVTEAA